MQSWSFNFGLFKTITWLISSDRSETRYLTQFQAPRSHAMWSSGRFCCHGSQWSSPCCASSSRMSTLTNSFVSWTICDGLKAFVSFKNPQSDANCIALLKQTKLSFDEIVNGFLIAYCIKDLKLFFQLPDRHRLRNRWRTAVCPTTGRRRPTPSGHFCFVPHSCVDEDLKDEL